MTIIKRTDYECADPNERHAEMSLTWKGDKPSVIVSVRRIHAPWGWVSVIEQAVTTMRNPRINASQAYQVSVLYLRAAELADEWQALDAPPADGDGKGGA